MNKEMSRKIGILISGRGSNMEAIIKSSLEHRISAQVVIVISDNQQAGGITIAQSLGIATQVIERKSFASKEEFEKEIILCLKNCQVDLLCLAGFMRILSPFIVKEFAGKILNIHPALLPSFPGLHAQKQALDYGAKISGATVHFVDEGVDTGPVIIQTAVPVFDNDTEEILSLRILEQEHKIYSEAIRFFFEGNLRIEGRKVIKKVP